LEEAQRKAAGRRAVTKPSPEQLRAALKNDRLIDIVTVGARTGLPRTVEIWFVNIDGRIVICGTPSSDGSRGPAKRRGWLANLSANPRFEFCLKESVAECLPARAIEVTDQVDRKNIMCAPETRWYREQGFAVQDLVRWSPIVEVFFLDEYDYLNAARPRR
jgi:hypothetical protein